MLSMVFETVLPKKHKEYVVKVNLVVALEVLLIILPTNPVVSRLLAHYALDFCLKYVGAIV